ncbi:ADP-ribosylglycohydrolase family protein [Halorubrum sp. SD626R]|jgi:ADP-ribosylglycohydrolase|uniref:ADP-ribosylglycohydrolase family protein n=1 Tax=Halorubrum sp. SD626R TaxID=1419722 RepID=UPI000A64579C|nr:ADP-ribosylglycohydrolase family protein [Halorubrum sp. SD626R]TKX81241.1 ADP-ribosylglycohydrolase family protein [Halorubrum sp. SD626R]
MEDEYLRFGPEALRIELRQLADAGRPVGEVVEDLETLATDMAADDRTYHERARELLDRCEQLPSGHRTEPDTLAAIRQERPDGPRRFEALSSPGHDALRGAWAGRCAGIRLGKPVETWTREEVRRFLTTTDQSLDSYLRADVAGSDEFAMDATGGWHDWVTGMPRDDDLDFTVVALETLRSCGKEFNTTDLAQVWLENLPVCKLHTAERVAYRNLLNAVDPPATARRWNPYRELIGAQIRADCYGYVTPGAPERAAELAFRDARLSHVANGCYGAMWVAAMLAALPAVKNLQDAVAVGLTEVPTDSRLAAAINDVLGWRKAGIGFEAAIDRIHATWDDADFYEGYHVVPNAQVVAAVLAWAGSDPDLGTALARAVGAGFDTDCNAGTIGSVVGFHLGFDALPDEWVAPIDGALSTALADRPRPWLEDLVTDTLAVARAS